MNVSNPFSHRAALVPPSRRRSGFISAIVVLVVLNVGACGSGSDGEVRTASQTGDVASTSGVGSTTSGSSAGGTARSSASGGNSTTPGTSSDDVNQGLGETRISGHAYDRRGRPLSGVDISIRIVPLSYGALYQTKTRADGSYSYRVPAGVYRLLAELYIENNPIGVDLEPMHGGRDVTVPPSRVVDFQLP